MGVGLKKSCSEFAETCSRFGIFEIRQKFFLVGGLKKKSCIEYAETCSSFGIFEIRQNCSGGGGGVKKKLFRMCWNMLWFWNFWNLAKKFFLRWKSLQTDTIVTRQDAPLEKRSRLKKTKSLNMSHFAARLLPFLCYQSPEESQKDQMTYMECHFALHSNVLIFHFSYNYALKSTGCKRLYQNAYLERKIWVIH